MNAIAQLPWDRILEILGFCTGLLYLWWEYHADSRLWIASIIMPTISMWIYLHKGLYADFSINIYYFVIAIYGYIAWTRAGHGKPSPEKDTSKESTLRITHISFRQLVASTCVFIALWVILYCGLRWFTDSTVPLADAFTTALSIVAMWLLARKYIEQWIAWIAVDAVCVGLYLYKGIYFYSALYVIYTVIAFVGYRKWLKLMQTESLKGEKVEKS